jgi:hypothetical protein
VRAPGGEPALVTRLDQGQLWFSAGRRRSPWRHEVHVGPAIVSTPRGRFQAVAESDGGATISCLAGRTRVVAGLREPVLLGPDQSAAVSSDGRTLVVMDRAAALSDDVVIDLTDDAELDLAEEAPVEAAPALATVGAAEAGAGAPLRAPGPSGSGAGDGADAPEGEADPGEPAPARPARLGWIPELVAVAALVGLLVAIVWVFTSGDEAQDAAPAPTVPATTELPATTEAPTTTESEVEIDEPATTDAPTTTEATTTAPPPTASGASAAGELVSCRRSDTGVTAVVAVTHRGGPPSRFEASASLIDDAGAAFATGSATSDVIDPGGSAQVEVPIEFEGRPEGSCELAGVTAA